MTTKIILLAHGSSDQNWTDTFVELAKPATQKDQNTTLAFMELSTPSLECKVKEAKEEGYDRVVVLPLFLAKGRHLRKDVPAMLKDYEEKYAIETQLLAPIGEHPILAAALTDIITDTTSDI